jgi:hypothetical protein
VERGRRNVAVSRSFSGGLLRLLFRWSPADQGGGVEGDFETGIRMIR